MLRVKEQRVKGVVFEGKVTVTPMPRILRGQVAGHAYHVLNRGNGGAVIFHKDGDYAAFLALRRTPHRIARRDTRDWRERRATRNQDCASRLSREACPSHSSYPEMIEMPAGFSPLHIYEESRCLPWPSPRSVRIRIDPATYPFRSH
jgi:hypothetical protein